MIGENIRRLRRERHITLRQLGEACSVSKQTVQRYESGAIENIPIEKIEAIANALNVTPSEIMGWTEPDTANNLFKTERRGLPILGKISCGKPIYADKLQDDLCPIDDPEADFCLVAKGDSMEGVRINDGDIVFIKAQETVDNGDIAAVIINDEATLKRVFYDVEHDRLALLSENPMYEPFIYTGADLECIRIIGKAVGFRSRLHRVKGAMLK